MKILTFGINNHILKPVYVLLFLILIYSGLCLLIYKDFGITFDEKTEYRSAEQLKEYFSKKTSFKNTIESVYEMEPKLQRHSPVISPYYRFYISVLSSLNPSGSYTRYHLLNMLAAGIVFINAIYWLIYKSTGKILYSILAVMFTMSLPRIFGDLATNPKDIPFAAFYLLALCFIYVYSSKKINFTDILILGLVFGIVQSLRTVGFSVYLIFVIYRLFLVFSEQHNKKIKLILSEMRQMVLPLLLIFITANFFMVITWPYMGVNYFMNLKELFVNAASFADWDNDMLFMGKLITRETRPWYYLFVWLGITLPLYVLIPAFLSPFIKNSSIDIKNLKFLLTISITLTFLMYLVSRPNVYNAARHFLFIYPVFALLAFITIIELITFSVKKSLKFLILAAILGSVLYTSYQLISLHPYQYIYFNELVFGFKGAYKNYETDYWGAAYKRAVEWVNEKSTIEGGTAYTIFSCENSTAVEFYKNSNIKRANSIKKSDYYLCSAERFEGSLDKIGDLEYVVERQSVPLVYVVKIKK